MLSLIVLFLATSVIFLVADAVMLPRVVQPVFKKFLGDTLYEGGFRVLPAALFYLTFVGGVIWFASWPALFFGNPGMALLNGAVLGFVAFGTYEFTSWAVMRDWHPRMVVVDLIWGVTLTGGAAYGGVVVTQAVLG
jgi:uncharacterized membrane protein